MRKKVRKKRFSSILIVIIFLLQIFSSFTPLTSVKAEESAVPSIVSTETAGSDTNSEKVEETEGTETGPEPGEAAPTTTADTNPEQDETATEEPAANPEQSSTTAGSGTTPEQTETSVPVEPVAPDPATPTVMEFPFITGGTLTDGNGKDISTETDVDKSSDVNINYDFSIPEDQTVAAGTSYSIQLTDQIKVKDVSSELKNSDGTVIGSISADPASNKVTVTFPDEVKGAVSGEFSISGQFDENKIGNSNSVSVNIGKSSVDVNFKQEEAEQQNPAEKPDGTVQAKPGEQTAGTNAVIATEAAEPKDITNQFQFITGASIKTAKDENDPVIGATQIAKNATIYAFYTWNIPNDQSVNEGDYYTMKLPSQFKDENLSNYPIKDDSGNMIATMDISGTNLTLTFTSYASEKSNVHGWFFIGRSLDESKIGYKNPENLVFYLQGESEPVDIPVNFQQPEPTVAKTGTYNSQAGTIDWTVTVNDKGVDVKNAKIVDKISSGQVLDESSVKYDDGSSVDNSYTDGVLTCNLGDIGEKKTIKFTTSISDDLADKPQGDYTYSNTAELDYGDDVGNPKKRTATSDVDVDVKLISKTGKYSGDTNKTIDWIITVNESGRSLGDTDNPVKITDTIPAGLKLIDGTVKIGDTKDTADTSVTANDYNYTFTDYSKSSEFTYILGNSITGKKVIKYSTSVDPTVYNSNTSKNYNNIACLSGYGVKDGTYGNCSVGVSTNILEKDGMGYDAKTGRLKWKIVVNKHQSEIPANAVVTDTIPQGQAYVTGTAIIDDTSNGSFTTLSDGEVAYKFTNSFSKTYTITFETQVTDTKVYQANTNGNISYKNTAKIEAGVINQSVTVGQNVNSNVITKTAEGYDYKSREITWEIVVNKNKMPITDATITDVITSGQGYVAGSTSIDNIGVEDILVNNPQNGTFMYKFSGTINESHIITFKTKLTDAYAEYLFKTQGKPEIKNTASVVGTGISTEPDADTDSEGTQIIDNPVITKEPVNYTNGNSYIDWKVKTNANWTIPLAGSTITDTLQDGLSLDTNTVELYKATVNSDGTLDQGVQVDLTVDNIEYNPDTRVFKFIFPSDAGSGAFILKFRTYAAVDGTYKNSVTFKGAAVTATSKEAQQAVSIYGGGGTGETGSIKIVKVDSTDTTKTLPGAVFQLLDKFKNAIKTSDPTGGDGSVIFDKLKYVTDYSVKEITAPTGYNLSSKVYTFQVNGADNQKNITYDYVDEILKGNIQFYKTGIDGVLQGAEFKLYKNTDTDFSNPIATATSESDGLVQFSDIPYGKYVIKETKAPEGYSVSGEVATADLTTITADRQTVKADTFIFPDSKLRGSIKITKIDASTRTAIPGVTIAIFDSNKQQTGNPETTGADGIVQFDNLVYGSYFYKEISAPDSYVLDSTYNPFSIETESTPQLPQEVTFENQKVKGTIVFTKADEDGNSLQGAEFSLYKDTDTGFTTPIKTAASDVNGLVQFTDVEYGSYTIRETKAPEGYNPYTETLSAVIGKDDNGKTINPTLNGNVVSTVIDTRITGCIEITKTDVSTSKPVPGATITVYTSDGKPVGSGVEGTTGEDGKVEFDNLTYGDYYFMETNAPEGYLLNPDKHPFSIKDNGVIVKDTLTDTKIKGSIVFTKTDEGGNTLSGVEFKLYKADDTAFETPVKTAISGSDGKVQFTDVEYGSYVIKETAVSDESYVLSTKTLSATIGDNDNGETITLDSYTNVKKKGRITIKKTDANGNPLSGAVFALYDSTGYKTGEAASGDDGTAVFTNVVYGQYSVKEIKAPTGYNLSSEEAIPVNVSEDGKTYDLGNIENTRITGGIEISKTDFSTSSPVSGATITVYTSDGKPVGSGVEGTTGEDGTVEFDNLTYGDYYFEETNAPEGYLLNPDKHPFSIKDNGVILKDSLTDTRITGGIKITKTDFSTSAPVPGATITIYKDSALTEVVASKVTGSDGTVEFDNLTYGHYYFVEKNAPEGYLLNPEKHTFSIKDNGVILTDSLTDVGDFAISLTANPNSIVGDGKSTSTLTAKVVDVDNKPVPGVKVDFSAPQGNFPDGSSAVTDENGEASVVFKSDKIEGVEPESIPVTAVVNDSEHGLHAQDHIDITFEPGSIQGTVWDNETGKPLGGVKVVVKNDSIDFKVEVITSDDGKYKVAVPEGGITYDVLITKPVEIGGEQVDKTFLQHSQPGPMTGNSDDIFDSEKTATGIVLIKSPDGENANYFNDYSKLSIEGIVKGNKFSDPIEKDGDSKGVFHIEDLEEGKDYVFNIVYDFGDGQKIVIGNVHIKASDGDMKISTTLIDPYGVVTDSVTDDKIPGADISLYYADTERNKDSGKTPGTLVQLPGLEDFPPAGNVNPQSSDEDGNYAFMVYPNTDYYIVAKKTGYYTLTTETISVNDAIVKRDIEMTRRRSSGGDVSVPVQPVQPVPEPTPVQPEPTPEPVPEPVPGQTGQNPDGNKQPGQGSDGSKVPEKPGHDSKGQDNGHANVSNASKDESNSALPKTGSIVDTTVLIAIGILFILAGAVLMFMRKKLYKDN